MFENDLIYNFAKRFDQQIMEGAAAVNEASNFSVRGVNVQCLWFKCPERHQNVAKPQDSLMRLQQTNQELQKSLAELDHLASTDKLTGCWIRRRLAETVVHVQAQ